jgi:hypothetical protein
MPRRAHARDASSAYAHLHTSAYVSISEPPPPPAAAASKVAVVRVTLGLDYAAAGDEGSEERELFVRDLTTDLGAAAGLPSACFEIMRLMPGSIVGLFFFVLLLLLLKKRKLDSSPPQKNADTCLAEPGRCLCLYFCTSSRLCSQPCTVGDSASVLILCLCLYFCTFVLVADCVVSHIL